MKTNIQQNIILLSMLILCLVSFNLSSGLILADEGEDPLLASSSEALAEEETPEPEPEPEIIETGDAQAVVEVENVIDSNIVEPPLEIPLEVPLASPCETLASESEEGCLTDDCLIEIVEDNEAEVENEIIAAASTGDNEIEIEEEIIEEDPVEQDATINTGNANVFVGVINIVNSNLIGSSLSQLLYNIFGNIQGDINVSDSQEDSECPDCCVNIVDDNEGVIDNEIVVNASTGNNSIENDKGDATINTGDANVVVDAFNVLNSNIISSNWTHLIINIFGNWMGDLVLPGKDAMQQFTNNEGVCGDSCDSTNIVSSNEGAIENNVDVEANTGDNEASGDEATINTGNANTQTNVTNIANSNVNDNWFFMAINNFGNWQGNIFSLPPGFAFSQDSEGVKLFNFDSGNPGQGSGDGGSLNIVSDNSGEINNAIVINASTGGNSANSENGSAEINTGDVNTATNIVNILNSNFTGTDALIGMINIFGNWQGDLAFGRPDLWIGESATVTPRPEENARVTYTLTFANQGDADATNVIITDDFDENYLNITDTGGGILIDNPGEIQWDLGTVPPGEVNTVSYTAKIKSDMPAGSVKIINQSQIEGFEDDVNQEDNFDSLAISVFTVKGHPNPVLSYPEAPKLELMKIANVDGPVQQGTIVDYAILITNNSDSPAYTVVVTDVLINGVPEPLNEQSWDLDHVFAHETIRIDYSVYIGDDVPVGLYTNTAQANGFYIWGEAISSNEASVTIEVIESPFASEEATEDEGEVLGEETPQPSDEGEGQVDEVVPTKVERIVEQVIGAGISTDEGPTPDSLAILIDEEEKQDTAEEDEIPNKFFLAAIGEFFSGFSLVDFLILLLIILIIALVLLYDRRRKLEK